MLNRGTMKQKIYNKKENGVENCIKKINNPRKVKIINKQKQIQLESHEIKIIKTKRRKN